MPNNPNTYDENESASLDAEDWEIALKPYFGYPDAALDLARNLMTIRECLTTTPPDARPAPVPPTLAARPTATRPAPPPTPPGAPGAPPPEAGSRRGTARRGRPARTS